MKIFKFFEIAYLVIAVVSAVEVVNNWNTNRGRSYLFLLFAVVSVIMFFFRRYYRKKFQERQKNN